MTTRLSSKGQIVLPAALRRKLGLQAGEVLEISVQAGRRIVMSRREPRRKKMEIVTDPISGLPVLKGPSGTPKLTSEMVKQLLADFP